MAGAAVGVELLARRNLRLEQAERASLGNALYREVRGRGRPVGFIAGFQGSTRYWNTAFEPLTDRYRLIFLDVLGFGRSPWPTSSYTLEDHLGALRRTFVEEGATRDLILVAHSFGTILAAYYASRFPEEVTRLVLLGTPVFSTAEQARERLWEMSPLAALFSLNRVLSRISCTVMCAFRPYLQKLIPFLRHDLEAAVVSDGTLHMWSSIDSTLQNVLLSQPIEAALQSIGQKVIFIHGREDTVTSIDRMRVLAGSIGAKLIETTDSHQTYIDRSRDAIIGAIDRVEGLVVG